MILNAAKREFRDRKKEAGDVYVLTLMVLQLFALTGVPPDRQKITAGAKQITDETDLKAIGLKDKQVRVAPRVAPMGCRLLCLAVERSPPHHKMQRVILEIRLCRCSCFSERRTKRSRNQRRLRNL
jgi:hypothetical protein